MYLLVEHHVSDFCIMDHVVGYYDSKAEAQAEANNRNRRNSSGWYFVTTQAELDDDDNWF